MNNYVLYGNNLDIIINDSSYVFITAFGELIGSLIFIFTLISTIANFCLKKSKAYMQKPFGWIVLGIAIGLLIALFSSFGIQLGLFEMINPTWTSYEIYNYCQMNLNPALVISRMMKAINYEHTNYIPFANGLIYLVFEFFGFMCGSILAFLFYKGLIVGDNFTTIRGCFFTTPTVRKYYANFFNEAFSTLIFVIVLIAISISLDEQLFYLKIILVGIIVMGLGYGIGGATGFALNPFRDFVPRLVYWIIYHKQDKTLTWNYCFIPLIAPCIGAILATILMPGFLY